MVLASTTSVTPGLRSSGPVRKAFRAPAAFSTTACPFGQVSIACWMRRGIEFGFVGIGQRLVAVDGSEFRRQHGTAWRNHRFGDIARILRVGGERQAERGQTECTFVGSHFTAPGTAV